MTDATFSPASTMQNPAGHLRALFAPEPRLAMLGLLLAFAMIPLALAMQIDPRQFQGESIWIKPLKFAFALSVYLLTLAAFARFLPRAVLDSPRYRAFITVVLICILGEMVWIGGAAMFGTASHFNLSSPVMQGIYGLMGVFAVTLTAASLVYGIAIWRHPAGLPDPALRLSLALGLGLTFVLTVVVAGYLSAQPGHLVGTPVTGARVPLMGWSREVGDLRLPHFLATHALHFIPLAGLVAARLLPERAAVTAVWAIAAGFALLCLASLAQAIMGLPAFPI